MEPQVEIAWIGMFSSIFSAGLAAIAVYLGARNRGSLEDHGKALRSVEDKVDGQLTETVALKQAVSFAQGQEKQRDKQDMKDAVAAGIKQANGPEEKT
jgi:hypothetical protein